jgi:hypothetical protein
MFLGSTQLLTEMSTRNIPGGKERLARKAHNLTAICEPIVYKMWEPRRQEPRRQEPQELSLCFRLLHSNGCTRDNNLNNIWISCATIV